MNVPPQRTHAPSRWVTISESCRHSAVRGYVDNWSLRKRYYAALEAAGLAVSRFHSLRHAFGSMAIRKLDPHTVQTYMRHAHYSTSQRYLHHQPHPEHARLLQEAFAESTLSGHASGHARSRRDGARARFACKLNTRGGTRTRTATKGQWLLRPSCLTNSTTRAGSE